MLSPNFLFLRFLVIFLANPSNVNANVNANVFLVGIIRI